MNLIDEYLDKINDFLEIETTKLLNYIKEDTPFESDIFEEIVIENIDEQSINELGKIPAIYIFKITNSLKLNIDNFDNVTYGAKINIEPNINENSFDLFININDILYVGKSHEINKRIREHTIRASDRTYSLRLFEPDRTVFNGKYKIYIFKCLNEKYFKMILSTIESILHEKLTPIVGSKRV